MTPTIQDNSSLVRASLVWVAALFLVITAAAGCDDDDNQPTAPSPQPPDNAPDDAPDQPPAPEPPADTSAPQAALDVPDGMVWHSRLYPVEATLSDDVAVAALTVAVNDDAPVAIDFEPDDTVALRFDLDLVPGLNRLLFEVSDTAGNSAQVARSIAFGGRVAAAGAHTLAVHPDGSGRVLAWGRNNQGQVGVDGADLVPNAVIVPGLGDVAAVAGNLNHSVALDASGAVWTWGRNDEGQLGRTDGPENGAPAVVSGIGNAIAIAAGQRFTLALLDDGTVWAWGANNEGQLGVAPETTESRAAAGQVPGLPADVVSIAAGGSFALALTADGRVWTWGNNGDGQLGTEGASRAVPAEVEIAGDARTAATGRSHAVITTATDDMFAWGLNASGQLATGDYEDRSTPAATAALPERAATVRAAGNFTVALLEDGSAYAWGQNFSGQLGHDSGTDDVPTPVASDIAGLVDLSAGLAHGAALSADGTLYTWGLNSFGQLGNGEAGFETSTSVPTAVALP